MPPVVTYMVMADDSTYEGISLVGILRNMAPMGKVSSFTMWVNDLTSPVGREPISDMIHLKIYNRVSVRHSQ